MARIKINDLSVVGADLFQSEESFLTELSVADAHQIYGGKKSSSGKYGCGYGKSTGKKRSKKRSKKRYGSSSGFGWGWGCGCGFI